MSKFNITVLYDDRRFRIKGEATAFIPARVNCSNDDAAPAEGGIEDITEVRLLDDKGNEVLLPDFLQEYLDAQVIDENLLDEKIVDALSEIEGDYE